MTHDLELERVANAVSERKCQSVLLLFPEGLKRQASRTVKELQGLIPGCEFIVSGEPCYGACDIPHTDADIVVNFGHLPIPNLDNQKPVLFVQAKSLTDPLPAVKKAMEKLPERVGLITTAQHIHALPDVVNLLKSSGVKARVGKGSGRLFAEGQVLGCDVSSALAVEKDVDAFLFIGTGSFHPLAVVLACSKPVVVADPITGEVMNVEGDKDRVLRQRHAAMTKAGEAKEYGVLLSTKPGQRREALARRIANLISDSGKSATLVEMGNVTPQKLDAVGLPAWVSTACPRLAIDDAEMFNMPVLTPVELEIVLGKRQWEDYAFDEIV